MSRYTRGREYLFVLLFFTFLTILFFRKVIFSPGIIVAHDWMLPYNLEQMARYIERPLSTWIYDMNLFGVKNPFFIQLPFMFLVKIFSLTGLSGAMLSKTLLIIVNAFSGLSLYLLLRYLKCSKSSSLAGGIIYVTMPVFFDYSIMGWCFVLFSIGVILPLSVISFMKSVEENSYFYRIITGLLFSTAVLQSQALVWFPMVFLALGIGLVRDAKSLRSFVLSFFWPLIITMVAHISWWPNLFIYKDPGVINADLALDSVSLGMRSRLNYINILRGWGGLFNYQYEISYPKNIILFSFVFPIMGLFSLTLRSNTKKDIRYSMIVILALMFVLFSIDPPLLARIPLSNIIRDTGRFTMLTSFAISVLATYTIQAISEKYTKISKYSYFMIFSFIAINAFPFWSGKLYSQPQNVYDVRLRNIVFPSDFTDTEQSLYAVKEDLKAFFPPSGTNIGLKNLPNFFGDFKEIKDPFRGYSPLPGTTYMYYSSMGRPTAISGVLDSLLENYDPQLILKVYGFLNIGRIVVRDDIAYPLNQAKNLDSLVKRSKSVTVTGSSTIIDNEYLVPHFYIPDSYVFTTGDISQLPLIMSAENITQRPLIIFGNTNTYREVFNTHPNLLSNKHIIFIDGKYLSTAKFQADIPEVGYFDIYVDDNSTLAKKIGGTLTTTKVDSTGNIKSDKSNIMKPLRSGVLLGHTLVGKVNLKNGSQVVDFGDIDFKKSSTNSGGIIMSDIILMSTSNKIQQLPLPKITFTKINSTKYLVNITGARESFDLVFSDSFHPGWKIFSEEVVLPNDTINSFWRAASKIYTRTILALDNFRPSLPKGEVDYYDGEISQMLNTQKAVDKNSLFSWGRTAIFDNKHFVANGYANGWTIDPAVLDNKDVIRLVIEFQPQRNFLFGLGISILFVTLLLVVSAISFIGKHRHEK